MEQAKIELDQFYNEYINQLVGESVEKAQRLVYEGTSKAIEYLSAFMSSLYSDEKIVDKRVMLSMYYSIIFRVFQNEVYACTYGGIGEETRKRKKDESKELFLSLVKEFSLLLMREAKEHYECFEKTTNTSGDKE